MKKLYHITKFDNDNNYTSLEIITNSYKELEDEMETYGASSFTLLAVGDKEIMEVLNESV